MYKIALGLAAVLMVNACGEASSPSGERTETVIQGVNYVGVSVSDIERSTDFYSGAADLQLVQENAVNNSAALDAIAGRDGVSADTRLLKSVNAQLRFMQFENLSANAQSASQIEVHGPGIAHICYQVAKKTKTYERFLEAGATPIGDRELVQLNPRNPVEYAYARDADGIIFEVEHVDLEKLDLDTPRTNSYRIRHVSLATPDIDRIVKFYSVLLEDPAPRRVGRLGGFSGENIDKVSGLPGSKLKMAWFPVRNLELEIIQYVSHPTKTLSEPRPVDALGYNMIVFDVTGLDAAREKLVAAGGTVVGVPELMDGGEIMFGRDPDGNLLGFQVVAPDAAVSSRNFKDDGR